MGRRALGSPGGLGAKPSEEFKGVNESFPLILKSAFFKKPKLNVLMSESDYRRLLSQLKWIGNNVNQIAKRVNTGLGNGWHSSLADVAQQLLSLKQFLRGTYGHR